jgi:hypothetical protein
MRRQLVEVCFPKSGAGNFQLRSGDERCSKSVERREQNGQQMERACVNLSSFMLPHLHLNKQNAFPNTKTPQT